MMTLYGIINIATTLQSVVIYRDHSQISLLQCKYPNILPFPAALGGLSGPASGDDLPDLTLPLPPSKSTLNLPPSRSFSFSLDDLNLNLDGLVDTEGVKCSSE